jgi:sterol desaturase/sphingolipid hydroxylase (fatty acid hydroxylase superfamily)
VDVGQTERLGAYEIDRRGAGRQFRSDFLEKFSRCHGLVPLVVYLPIIGWCLWASRGLGAGPLVAFVAAGLFVWTLAEYWLHRLVFHFERWPRLHYFIHGIHHMFPNDRGRVVMPPAASALPALAFWSIAWLVLGTDRALPAYAGFAIGYLWYDMTHFWTHVARPRTAWGRFLRRHHMLHHFKDHSVRFGVSTPLWDVVFGTLPRDDART